LKRHSSSDPANGGISRDGYRYASTLLEQGLSLLQPQLSDEEKVELKTAVADAVSEAGDQGWRIRVDAATGTTEQNPKTILEQLLTGLRDWPDVSDLPAIQERAREQLLADLGMH
jgi:hypothetical protein